MHSTPDKHLGLMNGLLRRISPTLYKVNKSNEERVSALRELLDKHGLTSKSLRADCQVSARQPAPSGRRRILPHIVVSLHHHCLQVSHSAHSGLVLRCRSSSRGWRRSEISRALTWATSCPEAAGLAQATQRASTTSRSATLMFTLVRLRTSACRESDVPCLTGIPTLYPMWYWVAEPCAPPLRQGHGWGGLRR